MFFLSYFSKFSDSAKSKKKSPASVLICIFALFFSLVSVWAVYKVNRVPSKAYCETLGEYSLLASTDYERESFFLQFGYNGEILSHSVVKIPSEGEVFEQYNALQKKQGLDLRPYMGKQGNEYILKLTKEGTEAELFAVMTVYRDCVVAVHITDFVPGRDCTGLCDL